MRSALIGIAALLWMTTIPASAGWEEGVAAFTGKDFETAAAEFEKVVDQNPDAYSGHYMLGLSLDQLGQTERALGHLRRAQELKPDDLAVRLALGGLYRKLRRYDDTTRILEEVDPGALSAQQRAFLYQARGEGRLKTGDGRGALQDLQELAKLRPDDSRVQLYYARAALAGNELDEAVRAFERTLQLEPENEQIKEAYARVLIRKAGVTQDSAEKRRIYLEATRLTEELASETTTYEILILQATAKLGAGLYEEATESGRRALARKPDDWLAHYYVGQAYSAAGKYSEAEAVLTRARQLASKPSDVEQIERQLGFLYEKQKQYADAISAYEAAGRSADVARAREGQQIYLERRRIEREYGEIERMRREAARLEEELRRFEDTAASEAAVAPMPVEEPRTATEPREAHAAPRTPTEDPNPGVPYVEQVVFYATDRAYEGEGDDNKSVFGPKRSLNGKLNLGSCTVSVPFDHQPGEVERPFRFLGIGFEADPTKHFKILNLQRFPEDRFYDRLETALDEKGTRPKDNELMVFIHGYNVSFNEAIRRTAQLAVDLPFEGIPITYSWPSNGSAALYLHDANNVYWSVPHLEKFLTDLVKRSGADAVHLIAHSMGNRVLTAALRLLAVRMAGRTEKVFGQIILTAPDVDAETFEELAREFVRLGQRITLYASSRDKALETAHEVHGYPRAGDTSPYVVVVPGIETIDATGVDTSLLGHSYYGDSTPVLDDLVQLLRGKKPEDPERQAWLVQRLEKGMPYWLVNPPQARRTRPSRLPNM